MNISLAASRLLITILLATFTTSGSAAAQESGPAPLIPREILFANPRKTQPQISPDGRHLAYLAPSKTGVLSLWVRTLGQNDDRPLDNAAQQPTFFYLWSYDSNAILFLQDRDGNGLDHFFSVNLKSGLVRDLTPFQEVRAQNLLLDPRHPAEALISMNLDRGRAYHMYRINLTTGAVALDTENQGDVVEWLADSNFAIRAQVALKPENANIILRVRDSKAKPWRVLAEWPFLEGGSDLYRKLIAFTPDQRSIYVQSPMGADKTRLVKLDAKDGKVIEVVAQDERSDLWNYPIAGQVEVLLNPATDKPEAVGFEYLTPEWKVLNAALRPDFETLTKHHPGVLRVVSRDLADRTWIVSYELSNYGTSFFVYDRKSKTLQHLFDDHPEFQQYKLAIMNSMHLRARDGFELPSYLTLPVGVQGKDLKLPLVVLVHGGPWTRDQWGFNPEVQLLANRGYAVLQVNFRGSTGFGKKFLNAGSGQWGVGAMQNDLSDAVQSMIEKGVADPKRIAIMGGSYGGYATLAGLAFTPQLYACGVDIVGPSNVKTLFASFPSWYQVRKRKWTQRVGDVEHDDELNRRISPLFHADQIRAPLLIAHGANDPIVKNSESDEIAKAARRSNVPVTYVVYSDEGHGMARPENNRDFYGRMEEFLGRCLGGRAEPWQKVEGANVQVK